jgi:DNA polymerase/3'-5' exonuclease PolX
MNSSIISEFERYIEFIQSEQVKLKQDQKLKEFNQNKFRLSQLARVLSILKKYPIKITLDNYTELSTIDGIGKGSLDKINDILENGKLSIIGDFVSSTNEKKQTLNELEEVVGIGRSHALELYKKGIQSVKDLKEKIKNKEIEVNQKIILGLKYYGKYKTNIPREEMILYDKFFQHLIKKINRTLKLDDTNKYIVEICGSYRREKATSNDIDVLISKIGTSINNKKQNHLEMIVNKLKSKLKNNNNRPLLVDSMTDKKIKTKYMGFSKLHDNNVRRIDIRFITFDSYHSALLYFTGSGELNKKMRQIAKDKGYKLSEYGLFDKNGRMIEVESERDIFKKLSMEYLPPRLR